MITSTYEIDYESLSKSSDFNEMLKEIVGSPKTQLIEVFCQHDQVVMPGVGNYKDEMGNLRSDPLYEMQPKISEEPNELNLILN